MLITRRDFLKISGIALGGAAASQFIPPPVAKAALDLGYLNLKGDGFIPSMCEMCVWRCGLIAKVKNGRVVKLEGNPANPHSKGKLCVRGQSGLMTTYDPDRVLYPLIRVGKRGEGKFRKASWEEALDLTASRMKEIKEKYGAEAMIFSSTHNLSQVQFENLLGGFGSPNYGTQRSLCFNSMVVAHLMTYGIEEPSRNYKNVKYILLTGRNLMEAISTSETSELSQAIDRGVKTIYIDPRFTKTAAKASEWIPIRPGTDLAFHLALLQVITSEKLYDKDKIEKYLKGLDGLPQAVASYTPEWAEKITGVAADSIRRIAREFAAARPYAMAHPGWRTSNFVNSFQTERCIAILNALNGSLFVEDGPIVAVSPEAGGVNIGKPQQPPYPRISAQRLDGVPWKHPLVPLKIGVFQNIRDAILTGDPYQARGWFISRQNPVLSMPDRRKTVQAMSKLDFIATVDVIMNDSSWYADVVLPEASYLERYDPLKVLNGEVWLRQPVIEPQGEAKSALWIYKELGSRLGLQDFFQYKNEEDYLRQQIAPLGISLEQLKIQGYYKPPKSQAKEEITFGTASGKVEIFSEALQKANFPGYPKWEEPPAPAPNQFYLLTGKVAQHSQMATQNNAMLNKVYQFEGLWLHPSEAEKRGLKMGDQIRVKSEVGEIITTAYVTEAIRPDCVSLTPGFGHLSKGLRTAYGKGASDSDLHVTRTDPVSGGQALSETFVTVEKL
ncbi:MAG: molybdopterin-dependent oxidoreductase [Chloroflexi bacterium]|nr:molybdopterin-dependent oxidoreductase [Chloroflexota bacterium]